MNEKKLEELCCKIARENGIVAVKLEANGHTGIPDRLFIGEGGRTMFVEFKSPTGHGRLSAEQKLWAEFLKPNIEVVNSVDQFEKMINRRFL